MDVDTKDACLKEKEVEYETKLAEISQLRLEIEQAETAKAAEVYTVSATISVCTWILMSNDWFILATSFVYV